MVTQGDVYWVDLVPPRGSGPGYERPYVVIQNNAVNASRIGTVIVCALTANLARARGYGNVLLDPGEANLPERSVVNISQVYTVDREMLGELIGRLSPARVRQVVAGLHAITEPRESEAG